MTSKKDVDRAIEKYKKREITAQELGQVFTARTVTIKEDNQKFLAKKIADAEILSKEKEKMKVDKERKNHRDEDKYYKVV